MKNMTPDQVAQKWVRNAGAARPAYEQGIRNVREAPTLKAARRADAWAEGCARAAREGKFARKLSQISLEEWQAACINKGAARYADGVRNGQAKFMVFMSEFMPYVEAGVRQLATKQRGDFETNLQRMEQMVRYLHNFRRGTNVPIGGFQFPIPGIPGQ